MSIENRRQVGKYSGEVARARTTLREQATRADRRAYPRVDVAFTQKNVSTNSRKRLLDTKLGSVHRLTVARSLDHPAVTGLFRQYHHDPVARYLHHLYLLARFDEIAVGYDVYPTVVDFGLTGGAKQR